MKRPIAVLFCLLMIIFLCPWLGALEEKIPSDAPDEELDDWNVHFAATAADLPTCDEDTNGRLYYVEADNQFQVCKTSGWVVIDIQGADGQDGAPGADGTSIWSRWSRWCKWTRWRSRCSNGADGADGQDGSNGQDGAPGADGQDGTSIQINAKTSTCVNGGNAFDIGEDTNRDGVLDASEVVISVDICSGADGADGHGADGAQGPFLAHKDLQEMMDGLTVMKVQWEFYYKGC